MLTTTTHTPTLLFQLTCETLSEFTTAQRQQRAEEAVSSGPTRSSRQVLSSGEQEVGDKLVDQPQREHTGSSSVFANLLSICCVDFHT